MKYYLLLVSLFILKYNTVNAENNLTGFPCDQSHFYALTNTGDIEELEIAGNSIISHGIVLSGVPGSGLALCNNVDGGAYSPTIYSCTSTNISHYNGTTWDTVAFNPQTYMGGCGGNGNYLYYTQPGSNHPYIYTYNAGVLAGLSITMAPAVADLAVDDNGNIWYFAGASQVTSRIRQLSPTGTLLQEFSCNINTYNAYGCFLLNGTLYLGLGSLNTVYPNSLLPITFTIDSAFVGTPMNMPGSTYSDFASCSPGIPASIENNSFDKNFILYPNPAGNKINIFTTSNINSFSICDLKGVIVKSGNADTQSTIDISSLSGGIYFIEFKTSLGIIRRKLIKE